MDCAFLCHNSGHTTPTVCFLHWKARVSCYCPSDPHSHIKKGSCQKLNPIPRGAFEVAATGSQCSWYQQDPQLWVSHLYLGGVKWSEPTSSCPTLCDTMNCSLSGFSLHRIFQSRILECLAISLSRGSSQPMDQTRVSCIAGGLLTGWATRKVSW